jgi:uncharacterized protein YjbI with pentapeptide repeats
MTLICFSGIFLIVYTLRPLFWTGGTGISDTLDKIFWGDIKQSETVVSKTVETDKQGNTVKTIETIKYDDGKTLWDWLSLLGVPFTLFFLGAWLQQKQQERAGKLSEDQQKIADNATKEEVLQTYFDRLSVLLIDKNLIALSNKLNSGEIKPEEKELLDSSLDVIRARTLSILRRFENDTERKTSVIRFLIESDIVGKSKLNLSRANLSEVKLQGANLSRAYLSGTNLSRANLQGAFFIGADLYWTNLEGANLEGADLRLAQLEAAFLIGADLRLAKLEGVNLRDANLGLANLRLAKLEGAKLRWANLEEADLREAELYGAELYGADLRGAKLEGADLRLAQLEGAYLSWADLKDIKWNSYTVWPDKSAFTDAKNIPEKLKKELGITP